MPKSFLNQLLSLLQPFKSRLFLVCGMILLFEFIKLLPTYVLARLVDLVLAFSGGNSSGTAEIGSSAIGGLGESGSAIIILLIILFVISSTVTLLEFFMDRKILSFLLDSEIYLLRACQDKLLALPLKYHEKNFTGKQVNLIHQGLVKIEDLFFNLFYSFVPTIVQIIISFSVMLLVNVRMALLFFVFVPIFAYLTLRMGKKLQPLRMSYHEEFDMAAGKFGETIMHIRTVQDFAQEQHEKNLYNRFLDKYRGLRFQRDQFERVFTAYRDMVLNIGRVCVLGYGVYLLASGVLTPGFFVFLVTLSEKGYLALFRIGRTYNFVSDSQEAVTRIHNLLAEESDSPEEGHKLEQAEASVVYERVTFSYLEERDVLRDVSFSIAPKETVAIVGRSGAGKSTIVKLLFRHFEPQSGQILFDGKDIRKISKKSLRRQMAIVSQDIELFHTTVRENILYGHKASAAELARVCAIAHVDDFVQRFPEKYETLVGERGVRLSGGQKQRIAIARALLRKPKLLVFDEATSSLDSESEQLIQKALWEISADFTVIIIAHRLSTIKHADKVLVLEDGHLVEQGKYQELVKQGGVFAHMVAVQEELRG